MVSVEKIGATGESKRVKTAHKSSDVEASDFISRYTRLLQGLTDAPKIFIEASAICLVSTFAGRKCFFMSAIDDKLFGRTEDGSERGKYLNLWFMIIGKSRVSRKSTVISKMVEMITAVRPSVKLPEDFTPEKLASLLAGKYDPSYDETRAIWIHDEVSGFFEDLKRKTYMSSTDTLLCRLKDCRDHTRSTLLRGDEEIKKPYLTVFVASTEVLPQLFEERMLRQGFLNRFIYLYGEFKEWKERRRTLKSSEIEEAKQLEEWLKALDNSGVIILDFDSETWEAFHKFEKEVDDTIRRGELGLKEGYCANLPEFLLQLACIYRLSRMSKEELEKPPHIVRVTMEDFRKAMAWLREATANFDKIIELMKKGMLGTKESEIEKEILRYLRIKGGKCKRTQLYRHMRAKFDIDAAKLDKVVNGLVATEEIRISTTQGKGKGRPTLVYELTA